MSNHVLRPKPAVLHFVQVFLLTDGLNGAVRVLGNNVAIIGPAIQKLVFSLFLSI